MDPERYEVAIGTDTADDEMLIAYQQYLDEHEGEALSVTVRRPRRGEAEGTYTDRGQILGYSIPVPDELYALLDLAWQAACSLPAAQSS